VVLVTRLRAGRSGVPIPVEARDFSLLQKYLSALGTAQHPIPWVSGFFSGGKAAGA
jgi:hypothetical protein